MKKKSNKKKKKSNKMKKKSNKMKKKSNSMKKKSNKMKKKSNKSVNRSLEPLNLSKRKFANAIFHQFCIHGRNYDVTSHIVWRPSWIEKRTFSD